MITKEIQEALSKPLDHRLVKWKIQTNPKKGKEYSQVVAYIDARDAAECLDQATGGQWSDNYALPVVGKGLECALTVCGETRKDVGLGDDAKELYSDSFKRAAVKFGVGRFLYRFPKVFAKVKPINNSFVLTDESKKDLSELAFLLTHGEEPKRWSNLFVLNEPMFEGEEASSHEGYAPQETEGSDTESEEDPNSEHLYWTTKRDASISDKVSEAILSRAEGDLDRAVELLSLYIKQRNNGLDGGTLKKVVDAFSDQGHQAEHAVMDLIIAGNYKDKDSIAELISYLALAVENEWTIDQATVHLNVQGKNIGRAISAMQPAKAA